MVQKTADTLTDLYLADETAWLDAMAELIRTGQTTELDYAHLAEYLTDMAIRDRREVKSRLRILLLHVLKWVHQQEMRTPSWKTSVSNQRNDLEDLLESRVLWKYAEESLASVYQKAVKMAADETGLATSTFPTECPWTLEQLLSEDLINE